MIINISKFSKPNRYYYKIEKVNQLLRINRFIQLQMLINTAVECLFHPAANHAQC
jgi:hypothetical protein